MIINSHAHFFTFLSLNTRQTRETLLNRLKNEEWPKYLVDLFLKVFDELLKDEYVDEEKVLRKLVGAMKVNDRIRGLLDKAVQALPGEVGILLHGDIDQVATGLLRAALARLFEYLSEDNDVGKGDIEDILGFLFLGLQSSMEDVAEFYFKDVPPDSGSVALMMDITKEGTKDADRFAKQTRDTSTLALAYPGMILPFFAVNPARKNCLNLLKDAAEKQGFLGVKLYPSLGYDPMSDAMKEVYEYCEAAELPILLHCNQGGFFFRKQDIAFADPSLWRDYLMDHPKLKVCFGHFGGDDELAERAGVDAITGWTKSILDLMRKHPGIYADVAYHVEAMKGEPRRQQYFKNLADIIDRPEFGRRVLWGSDYPLVRLRAKEENYWTFFRLGLGVDRFRSISEENPASFLGLPTENGTGAASNIRRHVEFLAANKYSVKSLPEEWVDRTLRIGLNRQVDFVVNPFGVAWTTHNVAHVYTYKALLVSRFRKAQWNVTFLDIGNMLVRDIPNWPLEVESDKNRVDTFWKFAMELDATLRLPKAKGGPGAVFETGVRRESAVKALEATFRNGGGRLYTFGNTIDRHYQFPEEVKLG